MLTYLLSLPVLLAVFVYSRKQKFDGPTIAMLFAAIGLYYLNLYCTHWDTFAIDGKSHADYVRIIANHDYLPHAETSADRHPPYYYVVAALFYKWAQYMHSPEPFELVRHVSMVCFVLFIMLSVELLRLVLKPHQPGYYCALALLLFWPIGVTMAGRITCDILLYTGQIGVLYCFAGWLQTKSLQKLFGAFFWSGISILAKNTGLIVLGISGILLLLALYEYRRSLRRILRRDLGAVILFALLCWYLTIKHGSITDYIPQQQHADYRYVWHVLGSFNIFLFLYDTDMGLSSDKFGNRLLHSLLLGRNMPWKSAGIQIAFHVFWLGIMLYIMTGLRWIGRFATAQRRVLYLCGLFAFSMLSAMIYMFAQTKNAEYSDGRYLYPVVSLIALCYGMVMEQHIQAGRMVQYRIGVFLAAGFTALTFVLFCAQFG